MAAFRARTMPGGQRGCFVEKEELRIPLWLHHGPMPAAQFQKARDPAPDLPRPHDPPRVVVKNTAVAHHKPATGERHDITERRNSVLQRHSVFYERLRALRLNALFDRNVVEEEELAPLVGQRVALDLNPRDILRLPRLA